MKEKMPKKIKKVAPKQIRLVVHSNNLNDFLPIGNKVSFDLVMQLAWTMNYDNVVGREIHFGWKKFIAEDVMHIKIPSLEKGIRGLAKLGILVRMYPGEYTMNPYLITKFGATDIQIAKLRRMVYENDGKWFYVGNKKITENPAIDIEKMREDADGLPYGGFLKSPYWYTVRQMVIEKHGVHGSNILFCSRCNCRVDYPVIHHTTYEHKYHEHEHLDDLIVICDYCHKIIHAKCDVCGGKMEQVSFEQDKTVLKCSDKDCIANNQRTQQYTREWIYR